MTTTRDARYDFEVTPYPATGRVHLNLSEREAETVRIALYTYLDGAVRRFWSEEDLESDRDKAGYRLWKALHAARAALEQKRG